jgi:transposase
LRKEVQRELKAGLEMERVRSSWMNRLASFLVTLENWMDKITNYFVHRLTSGFVEGFDDKVRFLKRRCFGIIYLKHIFQRLYLDLRGY